MILKVAVGSVNPTKVNSVEDTFTRVFNERKIETIAKNVASGVAEQPFGEEKTIKGAINRAKNCLEAENFGVGIEGGVHKNNYGYFLRAWVAIWDGKQLGLGGCAGLPLPSLLGEKVEKNKKELGELMDNLTNRKNIGKKEGCFGVFTENHLPRRQSFHDGIIVALSPFLCNDLYNKEKLKLRL